MNWLDIILIIINVIVVFGIIAWLTDMACEGDIEFGVYGLIAGIFILFFTLFIPFLVIDKSSGSTIGTITSVDKNFFGTTSIYIKTSENSQEQYCIEFDKDLENKAKEYIGKDVKVSYGTRVGFYSTGKCSQAPIETIELVEGEK